MLLPAAFLILAVFFVNYGEILANVQKGAETPGNEYVRGQLKEAEPHPAHRMKRFIKQGGISGRFIPSSSTTTTSKPSGATIDGRSAPTTNPHHHPPSMAGAIGGRSSFPKDEPTIPREPQLGRSMSPPRGGEGGPMTSYGSDGKRGGMAPPQPAPPAMGRSMGPPPPPSTPWQSGGPAAPPMGRSMASHQNLDDTDGAKLHIGIDIAANLCALQDEFEATGSPPKHPLPDRGSKYLKKYQIRGNEGCYAFKWTHCEKRGNNGNPCGWYQLALC